MYNNKKILNATNMEMIKLDLSNINFLSKANLIFFPKESEDGDSRISKISGIELSSVAYYNTRTKWHFTKTESKFKIFY
jgi:hypothetical protein